MTAAEDRWLLKQAEEKPRRLAPGTLVVDAGGGMTWTERCRANCPHRHGECHAARSGLVPRPRRTP